MIEYFLSSSMLFLFILDYVSKISLVNNKFDRSFERVI